MNNYVSHNFSIQAKNQKVSNGAFWFFCKALEDDTIFCNDFPFH